jgi:hypothetical protein
VAGALDRPETCTCRIALHEAQSLRVTACVGSDRALRDNHTDRRRHDRQDVLVPVRVDADHVIQLVCNHSL